MSLETIDRSLNGWLRRFVLPRVIVALVVAFIVVSAVWAIREVFFDEPAAAYPGIYCFDDETPVLCGP